MVGDLVGVKPEKKEGTGKVEPTPEDKGQDNQ